LYGHLVYFYGPVVYFVAISYIFWSFGVLFRVLESCIEKNMTTLPPAKGKLFKAKNHAHFFLGTDSL
jgi:hypothetical protein